MARGEDLRLCQVGSGSCVPIDAVVASSLVGVEKPDPKIFEIALRQLGVTPDQSVYVGDSVFYDIEGARAANIFPIHFDPFIQCSMSDHQHARSLHDALRQALARTEAAT
jgi:putative hydrolase of the HAD superfamily